jgi:hypothetical protein
VRLLEITDQQLAAVNLQGALFRPELNYSIVPNHER